MSALPMTIDRSRCMTEAEAGKAVLELRDVEAPGLGGDGALRGVSMVLGAGELRVVLGEHGAGVRTLLGVAAGRDLPSRGERRAPAFPLHVPARPEVGAHLRVRELGTALLGDPEVFRDGLLALGLEAAGPFFFHELNPPARAAAVLAAAAASRASLVLLEDPFADLDLVGARAGAELLRALAGRGAAVLIGLSGPPPRELGAVVTALAGGRAVGEAGPDPAPADWTEWYLERREARA